jgi:hypothetical protein
MAMAGVMWLLHSFTILIILPVGGLTYLATTLLLRTIPRSDIQAIYLAVRNRKQGTAPELIDTLPLPALTSQPLEMIDNLEGFDDEDDEQTLKLQTMHRIHDENKIATMPLRAQRLLPKTPQPETVTDPIHMAIRGRANTKRGDVR